MKTGDVTLRDVQKRIETSDLPPSRTLLYDGLNEKIKTLETSGIASLPHLRNALKTPGRMNALSQSTGITAEYLNLLRREIESWFPKPFPLKAFPGLSKPDLEKLAEKGIGNTAALRTAARKAGDPSILAASTGVDRQTLDSLLQLADLTGIRWVNPTFAMMLADASYDTVSGIKTANAETLLDALERVNRGDRYFKGKISLRDIKRLIHAAGYAPDGEIPG